MNLLLHRKLRVGLSLCALTGLLAVVSANAQTTATETQEEQKTITLEKYDVTGSRIRRLDAETVSPVLQMTAQEISIKGFTTLGDALRAMPYNSGQALTPTDSGTSFTPGVSTINLRGLGNNSTLVLINGRRGVPYASPGFNGFQTVFDMNSIPAAAIESVEILKDGGSALYGSDAVAGVVNVKLRRDYEGLSSTVQIGDYFNTGGFFKKASAVIGTSSAKTSVVTALSWEQRDAVFARDLYYTRNADKIEFKNKGHAYWTVHNLQGSGYNTPQEYFTAMELTDPVNDLGLGDNTSSRGYPGRAYVGGRAYTFTNPTSTPTVAGATPGTNWYNYQVENGLFPEYRQLSFYTSLRYDVNEKLYAFAEMSFSRMQTEVNSASTPADLENSHGLTTGSANVNPTNSPGTSESEWGLHIPAYNPYNPWAVDIFRGNRRMWENGPRINDVTSDTPRFLVGLGGTLANDWTWEFGAMYSKNTVDNLNRGTVPDYRLQQALMGLTRQGDGSLSWDPTTPQAGRVYYNWFGENEAAMANFLTVDNPNQAYLEYKNFDISTTGSVFESLPAGAIGVAVGAEHRQEKFGNVKSDLNATGNVLGGSEGTSSYGTRELTAIYVEADIPLLKNAPLAKSLELQVAGRYEDYSDDGFARQARPKLGLKWRPLDWLVVRGSYAKSFKAPDMAYLYTSSQTSFTSSQILDPVTGSEIDQLQIVTGGNPNLAPELTDTYYAGVVISPRGKLDGLNVSVDWFQFDQKNLLAQLSDFYGYNQFLSEAAAGNSLFADKVVRDQSGEVLFIRDDYANISTGKYAGMDVDVNYTWKSGTWGTIFAGIQVTWIDQLLTDGDNLVGGYLVPRLNGTSTISWNKGDWGVNLFGVFRGRREYHALYGSLAAEEDLYYNYDIKSQYTQNVSVTYRGFRDLELSVGVNNIFDQQPPLDFFDGTGTTSGVNDPEPAFWYMRAEMKF
ncbi:TonB-dependent receptor plug domain-containing protein [Opitutus terrae]|uniref:TonB-dependent receptor n=1 Tax=Opitutus terrae (strain DSM 11246 / JCM 15787 / PB90-1) TaxID=452637 RepID=B1ZUF4_OPITP|nr:TonB-dependent receptor [Opitutus terrae]ACB73997.1 TonB-dependent receptor [Opitutus terrae PB90-1]